MVTGVFYLILSRIGYGLSSGMQIQMARRAGEGDKKGLQNCLLWGHAVGNGFLGLMMLTLWLCPCCSAAACTIAITLPCQSILCTSGVLGVAVFNDEPAYSVHSLYLLAAPGYLYMARWSLHCLISFSTTCLCVGNSGLSALGFRGAAVASVSLRVFYAITMVGMFFSNRLYHDFPVFNFRRCDFELSQRT